jgi:hypothetical protein
MNMQPRPTTPKRTKATKFYRVSNPGGRCQHLVVHSDVNVLLTRIGNDLLLLLALQVRQLLNSLLNDLKSTLDLLVSNDKGWCQTDNVLVGRFRLRDVSIAVFVNR